MGKAAKANAARRDEWTSSLTADENVAREAAENLLRRFILPESSTGMCYRMTYLLHLYLSEKAVPSVPVVGWVTDPRDDLAISHAWVEVGGKKIDLTIGLVSDDSMLEGNVLVLDKTVIPGSEYEYFPDKLQQHLDADAGVSDPRHRAILSHKNIEHQEMKLRSTDPQAMRAWLDKAPDGWTYELLKARIEGRDPRSV